MPDPICCACLSSFSIGGLLHPLFLADSSYLTFHCLIQFSVYELSATQVADFLLLVKIMYEQRRTCY